MIYNYLKLALRIMIRNPFFTGINVVGLAIGFASFYILWEYSISELRSELHHKDAERIARVGIDWRWTDDGGKTWGSILLGTSSTETLASVANDFPEVESSTRIILQSGFWQIGVSNRVQIRLETQRGGSLVFREENGAYADPNLFTFFSIPLLDGEPETVLRGANHVALSQSTAEKYFGEVSPVGQLLTLNDSVTLSVSGVFEDLPSNTHLKFDFVISNGGIVNKWDAGYPWATNYIKLVHPNFNDFENRLNEPSRGYLSEVKRMFPNTDCRFFVQPLIDIPFSDNYLDDTFRPKSRTVLYTLAFIAFSVLIMALANYVNLTIVRVGKRYRELATRRVSGAGFFGMAAQFVTESFLVQLLAIALALTLIQIVRDPVAWIFHIPIVPFSKLSFASVLMLILICLTAVFLSGLYPAIVSMAHSPRILFSTTTSAASKRMVPSLLTVGQLTAAIILITLVSVISLQIQYILSKDTGIKKDDVVILDSPVVKPENYQRVLGTLKNELAAIPGVSAISSSRSRLADNGRNLHIKRAGGDSHYGMDENSVDEDFILLYDIKVIAGRNFNKNDAGDRILISRVGASRLNFHDPEAAIGAQVMLTSDMTSWTEAQIIGVFEDFRVLPFLNMNKSNTEYTNDGSGPGTVLTNMGQTFSTVQVTPEYFAMVIEIENVHSAIDEARARFDLLFPGNVFNWYFLDEHLNNAYINEKAARNQILLFASLALFIACLGLLGMISNKVAEKTKEIGIRKVLGAKLHQVAGILLGSTLWQIVIAAAIGIPISYYLINLYLDRFSSRIQLHWWHYAVSVQILMVIMLGTVGTVVWRAARSNPVEALKYE